MMMRKSFLLLCFQLGLYVHGVAAANTTLPELPYPAADAPTVLTSAGQLMVFPWQCNYGKLEICVYDLDISQSSPKWTIHTTIGSPVSGVIAGTAVYHDATGQVHLMGGKVQNGPTLLAQNWAFDPSSFFFFPKQDLPSPNAYHSAVADGDSIYMVGGYTTVRGLFLRLFVISS
jgi:outer membrane protein assembly factor BamB